jgi:hypothetical protein
MNRVFRKVTLSSPFLWASFHPLFQQSEEILLNLTMKCWNLAFNAQGSRVIIVVLQVRAERMKLSLPQKIDSFLSFILSWMLMSFFCGFVFFNTTLCMTKLRVLELGFFLTLWITLVTYLHSDPILYRRSYQDETWHELNSVRVHPQLSSFQWMATELTFHIYHLPTSRTYPLPNKLPRWDLKLTLLCIHSSPIGILPHGRLIS